MAVLDLSDSTQTETTTSRLYALSTIDPTTVIFFTDNEWNGETIGGTGAFNTGEGSMQWNSGASSIPAGTVIDFSNTVLATRSVDFGSIVSVSGTFDLANSDEQLWAFLGTSATAPTTFLAVFASESTGVNSPDLGGTSLVSGSSTQIVDGDDDVLNYTGPTSGQAAFANYLSQIGNPTNWTVFDDSGDQSGSYDPPDAFSVVPEPGAFWFGGLVCGVIGLAVGGRRLIAKLCARG